MISFSQQFLARSQQITDTVDAALSIVGASHKDLGRSRMQILKTCCRSDAVLWNR